VVGATPRGRRPRYVLRDRDHVDGGDVGAKRKALGIQQLLTPGRAPRADAVAERMVGSFRRERGDHLLVVDEQHPYAPL
jgi:putative transposase